MDRGHSCIQEYIAVWNGNLSLVDRDDFVHGVDLVPTRDVIDNTVNLYGELLIDFLVGINFCMLNGRYETGNNFTYISPQGRSVVDYVLVPHEQIPLISDFQVLPISSIIDQYNADVPCSLPDHSILQYTLDLSGFVTPHDDVAPLSSDVTSSTKWYSCKHIPKGFLNNDSSVLLISQTIDRIQKTVDNANEIDHAYDDFVDLIHQEMEDKLPVLKKNSGPVPKKSFKKPYWCNELQNQWDMTSRCEREWLRSKAGVCVKARLKQKYCDERRKFDRLNRKLKQQHQKQKQFNLLDKLNQADADFWKIIGNLGIANERKQKLPMEVKLEDGTVVSDVHSVLSNGESDL
ncbi:uncharacterized protein LOC124291463 [Haliotis rubra]|uniref:uncharacterized protein LOC124291463 n=1 Tax=Haliotis rubra TaxID=36100 RepID=UPI001EE61E96|nr:uncharacterized protein LOC124291463 [Haliotis rubra]